jgi:ABC-type molybdate transport system permease subunit
MLRDAISEAAAAVVMAAEKARLFIVMTCPLSSVGILACIVVMSSFMSPSEA